MGIWGVLEVCLGNGDVGGEGGEWVGRLDHGMKGLGGVMSV